MRAKWDPLFKELKKFHSSECANETLNRFTFTYESPVPLIGADREFYINEVIRRDWPQKGDISIFAKSLPEHEELPIDKSNMFRVRATLVYSGLLMRPLIDEKTGEEHTEFFMVSSVDIAGWIPTYVANWASKLNTRSIFESQERAAIEYLNPQESAKSQQEDVESEEARKSRQQALRDALMAKRKSEREQDSDL